MIRTAGVFVMALLALAPLDVAAEPLVLILSPERTRLTFTVGATGHAIEGVLALDSGEIHFDPETGEASGQVLIDLRRAVTGNRLRDHEMRTSVLETEQYPIAMFRPSRVAGTFAPSGPSQLTLAGLLSLHGTEHSMILQVLVNAAGETVSAETVFEVPYVAWGLKNPSFLFLRVAPIAAVSLRAEASLHPEDKPR